LGYECISLSVTDARRNGLACEWLLSGLLRAMQSAEVILFAVMWKANFWQRWTVKPGNERQIKWLKRLPDGFECKLTRSKWAAVAKRSSDTARHDINGLMAFVVFYEDTGGLPQYRL